VELKKKFDGVVDELNEVLHNLASLLLTAKRK